MEREQLKWMPATIPGPLIIVYASNDERAVGYQTISAVYGFRAGNASYIAL